MSEEQKKLNIIDELLSNDNNFQYYINNIENQDIAVPQELTKNMTNHIKLVDSVKEFRKYNFIDILKVACFALVTVLSWELVISINNIDYSKLQEKTEIVSFSNKDNTITNKLGEFMMDEIIKGGEKN